MVNRFFSRLLRWNIDAGDVIPAQQIQKERNKNSRLSADYLFRCIASALVATLGLIGNSTAVVIAAMIIAPLMDPLLGLAVAISHGKARTAWRSFLSFLIGSASVFLSAYLLSSFVHVNAMGSEIFSRTSPSLIDLFIALLGGSVAAYITTRSNISNAIAGVAIAVALVPPLCVGGIGLTLSPELNSKLGTLTSQDMLFEITFGSLLLYGCNFIGIVAAAVITYLSQSIGSWKRSILPLALLTLLSVLILKPLQTSYQRFLIKNHIRRELSLMGAERIQQNDDSSGRPRTGMLKNSQFQTTDIKVQMDDEGRADVRISLSALDGEITQKKAEIAGSRLARALESQGIKSSRFQFRVVPVKVLHSQH